jgi:hypothetical protein
MFYKANQSYSATLTGNYTVGDTVLSVSSIPSNTPTIITVSRGTNKETRFTVTGTGSGQLTGVARLDGATENITSGSAVECMNDADFVNQLSSAVYDQSGLKGIVYAADGGSNDTYVISLAVNPTSLANITGLPIAFKANTANTGACTLAVNGLTATAIKKNVSADLDTGDILAGQVVTVVYDGTNFQIQGLNQTVTPTSTTTLTNKRRVLRVDSQATTDTITPEISTYDVFIRTAQAHALVINNHSTSTPNDADMMEFIITGDATPRAITYGDKYGAYSGTALPSTTVASKTTKLLFQWRAAITKWDLLTVAQEA